jgi:hypothetical protein
VGHEARLKSRRSVAGASAGRWAVAAGDFAALIARDGSRNDSRFSAGPGMAIAKAQFSVTDMTARLGKPRSPYWKSGAPTTRR